VDLTRRARRPAPVRAGRDQPRRAHRRLGLDASLGLASSRLAARVASAWAKPRGCWSSYRVRALLPGRKPLSALGLLPHLASALERAASRRSAPWPVPTRRPCRGGRGRGGAPPPGGRPREQERPSPSPPRRCSSQEEATVRDRRTDRVALDAIADSLARRAARRLKPFRSPRGRSRWRPARAGDSARRSEAFSPGLSDEDAVAARVCALFAPLLEPADGVRALSVRASRGSKPPTSQAPLFPAKPGVPPRTVADHGKGDPVARRESCACGWS